MSQMYNICQRYHGKVVSISCRDGRKHVGRIVRVTPGMVYIQPTGGVRGGFGCGYYGRGWGWGYLVGIPLAFITGVVLGALLFW